MRNCNNEKRYHKYGIYTIYDDCKYDIKKNLVINIY